jgi:hypothetical protein
MPAETSNFDAFLLALRQKLQDREGLVGVQVGAAPLGSGADSEESIWFDDVDLTQAWGMVGNYRRDESFTLDGHIWVTRPGKGEDVADEVRARVRYLQGEVETCLRLAVLEDRIFKGAEFQRATIRQGFNDDGRVCRSDFTVEVQDSLTSS